MKAVLVSALVAMPCGAAAADTTIEACRANWALARSLVAQDTTVQGGEPIQMEDGWCVARDLVIVPDSPTATAPTIDLLRWRGQGLDLATAKGPYPAEFEIEVTGQRMQFTIADPVYNYLLTAQSAAYPNDFAMRYTWDQQTRLLDFTMSLKLAHGWGRNRLAGTIDGVDLSSLDAVISSTDVVGVSKLEGDLDLKALWDRYLMMIVGNFVLSGSDDPARTVKEMKAQAHDVIATLPTAIFADNTLPSLVAMVDDLPNLKGQLVFSLNATPAISSLRLVPMANEPFGTDAFWSLLDGVNLEIDYVRYADE